MTKSIDPLYIVTLVTLFPLPLLTAIALLNTL